MRRLLCLFLIAAAVSCSDFMEKDFHKDNLHTMNVDVERISGSDSLLTTDDASIVARLEKFGVTSTKSNDAKTVDEVIAINNAEGKPIIYAVNFKGGGYLLVSATKKYYPILAKSEDGFFSEQMYDSGMEVLFDEYQNSINICEAQPKDSLVKIRALWNKYEEFKPKERVKTKSDALFDLVSSSIEQWNAQGVRYYFLYEGCPNFLTESEYQNYISLASEYGNPNYDYMQNSVILVQTSNRSSSKGPLTSTCWQQLDIYNDKIQNVFGANYPAGCVAIATGQLMAYHRYPTRYNWDNILASTNPDISNFIYDVAQGVNTEYGIEGSSSDITDAKLFLESQGYEMQMTSHNQAYVQQSIYLDMPVYMRGRRIRDDGSKVGHTWVCDGYVYDATDVTVSLQVVSLTEPLCYQTVGDTHIYTTSTLSFYMNWGRGNYSSLHTTSGVASDWFDANFQYKYDRDDLIYVSPLN